MAKHLRFEGERIGEVEVYVGRLSDPPSPNLVSIWDRKGAFRRH